MFGTQSVELGLLRQLLCWANSSACTQASYNAGPVFSNPSPRKSTDYILGLGFGLFDIKHNHNKKPLSQVGAILTVPST
jgi:hypothetical protein